MVKSAAIFSMVKYVTIVCERSHMVWYVSIVCIVKSITIIEPFTNCCYKFNHSDYCYILNHTSPKVGWFSLMHTGCESVTVTPGFHLGVTVFATCTLMVKSVTIVIMVKYVTIVFMVKSVTIVCMVKSVIIV